MAQTAGLEGQSDSQLPDLNSHFPRLLFGVDTLKNIKNNLPGYPETPSGTWFQGFIGSFA